jgi:hypothetical protein
LSSGFDFFLDRFGFESDSTDFFDPAFLVVGFFAELALDAERCLGFFGAAGCSESSVEGLAATGSDEGSMVEGEETGSLRGSVTCSS